MNNIYIYKIFQALALYFIMINSLQAQDKEPRLVSWQDIAAMPPQPADTIIQYGKEAMQFGELRLPKGKGKFPVALIIHGGCWLSAYDLQYMSHMSEALRQAGFVTWTLEFRRVGNVGGGWPGTFLDVAQGTDFLRELAKQYPLDLDEVVVLGHSAGGHLGLWLAARKNIATSSELFSKNPLPLKGVVSLAGITDLSAYAITPGSCNSAVPQLMGGLPDELQDRYASASPIALVPLQVKQRLIQGALDPIVPIAQSQNYTRQAKAKGDDAEQVLLENIGHFDLVVPSSPAWLAVENAAISILSEKKAMQLNRTERKRR
jgi:acetyl esterase/lipase